MGERRSRARNTGCGVGSGIRSLPPVRAALPAAANVGFLLRVSLRKQAGKHLGTPEFKEMNKKG